MSMSRRQKPSLILLRRKRVKRRRLNTNQEKTEREQAAKKERDLARQNAGFQSSFDQLLYEYPIQHLGLLSQSSILILIRSVMVYTKREGVDLKNNRFLQTNLTRLLNIYFSKDRWLMGNPHPDHRLSDGIEPMQLKTFQEIYDVLDSTTIAALLLTTYRLRLGNMISEQNGRRVKTEPFGFVQ